jgi:hypothetical protein
VLRFLESESEKEAVGVATELAAPFVLTAEEGGSRPPASIVQRSQREDGVARAGQPHLGHFRLATEGPRRGIPISVALETSLGAGAPYKLYQVVEGGLLEELRRRLRALLAAGRWLRAREAAFRHASSLAFLGGLLTVLTYAGFQLALAPFASGSAHRFAVVLPLAACLMLPVSLLSGILFPLIGAALHRDSWSETRSAGLLTLANTLGGALGALAAGFLLLPALGMERSFSSASRNRPAIRSRGRRRWVTWRLRGGTGTERSRPSPGRSRAIPPLCTRAPRWCACDEAPCWPATRARRFWPRDWTLAVRA